MEKDDFSRRWRRLKTPEEKRRFLAEELNSELGSFDSFRGRLPAVRNGAPSYLEECSHMSRNNTYFKQTENAMFGATANRSNQSSIVNRIVEEMTSIPTLIEDFNPSTSQFLKVGENGSIKRPKVTNDYQDHRSVKLENNVKVEPPRVENHRNHTNAKASSSEVSKSNHFDQQSPSQHNHKQQSPVNHKHRLENSTEARISKKQRLDSPQVASTSAQIPKIELPYISPLRRPTDNYSRPSSRQGTTRTELFVCKFPDFAIGEYYGYRISKTTNDKSPNLPDSVVSINIRKMPNVKEIMTHVKNCVRKASKPNQLKSSDLIRALYMSGLMLYVVQKASASILNDLLREILSIISTIRSVFFTPNSFYSQSRHFTIASNMLHLAESYLCERLYENTLEFACKRRELLHHCQTTFASFDSNEELVPSNFGNLLEFKDQEIFTSLLSDLCAEDKVTIPKLYYQLLLENSQHAMLHEKYVYSKRLCIQQMENLEPALWKHLTTVMQFQLDQNSCVDIADAIFSLVHWMSGQS